MGAATVRGGASIGLDPACAEDRLERTEAARSAGGKWGLASFGRKGRLLGSRCCIASARRPSLEGRPYRRSRPRGWWSRSCPSLGRSGRGRDADLPQVLSDVDASRLSGGVGADIVWLNIDNASQSYDNLRFQVSIDAPDDQTSVTIGAFNGSTGTASRVVPLFGPNATGTFHSRTFWPHANGAKYDLVMKYISGTTWYDCSGTDPSADDQYLLTNVKVHRLRVHNTNALPDPGGYTTTWTSADMESIADNGSTAIPGSASNTIDGIYGQCGALQANGTDKTQWRRTLVDTVSIPVGCSDLTEEFATCGNCESDCAAVKDCANAMMDNAGQTDDADAHIYVVNELGCVQSGITAGALMTEVDGRWWSVIADQFDPSTDSALSTSLIAHELTHATPLDHTNMASDNCDEDDDPYVKNLMCNDLGRLLTDFQCDALRVGLPYTDRN